VECIKTRGRCKLSKTSRVTLLVLVLYVFLVYFYFVTRFNGAFIETDTSNQTQIIYRTEQSNSILASQSVYANGFVYTAISIFVLNMTGISLESLQIIIYPLLTVILVAVLFVTYRQLTESTKVAILATFFIFLQPDFLFVTWRGSHERVTWLFSLILLFCISKSFNFAHSLGMVGRFMLVFYLSAFALISTNILFASSYMVGLGFSFVGGYLLLQLRQRFKLEADPDIKSHLRRLFYIALTFGVFLYVFTFYLYPPAKSSLQALNSLTNRVAALTLNTEPATTPGVSFNPYTTFVSFSTPIYLLLTSFSWIMLAISGISWLRQGYSFFRTSVLNRDTLSRFVLWLIYAAYAAQLLISVFADRSNSLSGNLQTRIFTPLNLLVMPLTALLVWEFFDRLNRKAFRRIFMIAGMAACLWFGAASLLKAPIDPLLGNKWIFNTEPEQITADWIVSHIPAGSTVWAGYDERLTQGVYFHHLELTGTDLRLSYSTTQNPVAAYYFFSTLEQTRWLQSGRPLVDLEVENRIYDNGTGVVYHRLPQTPYE
jgi:hypothetical protein